MSKRPSSLLNMALALVIVTLAAAIALGFVYQWTKEPIQQAQLEKQMRAIDAVVGTYDNDPLSEAFFAEKQEGGYVLTAIETAENISFYPAKLNDDWVGFAIKSYSENGYSGRIEIMVGLLPDGSVNRIEVLRHLETPGLGSKIKDEAFMEQFKGKALDTFDFRVTKDGGEVDGISGATISTRAYSEAVVKAMTAYKDIKDEKGIKP
jgi:electron transport complex protein RnfG